MQGWLSLSDCGPGQGTLRLLPSLKLSTAYIMLRPFFVDGEDIRCKSADFPRRDTWGRAIFPHGEVASTFAVGEDGCKCAESEAG